MKNKKSLMDSLTISNIAYAIYHSEQLDLPMKKDIEEKIHNDLEELNKLLYAKLGFNDAETVFKLAIDYGEHCSEKYFEEGFNKGLMLLKTLIK
ncbi:MAG: hypothetical protein ACK5MV_13360 [Aminipila sp.]